MRRRRPRAIVLDSWAVLAYLQGEPLAELLADIIADALENKIPVFMSVINLGEVWYILAREVSTAEADGSLLKLQSWGMEFVDADWNFAHEAAIFKSKFKISYADAFAAALAKARRATLVTGDSEFKPLEEVLNIHWMRS